jgi:hypothetical protein
MTGRFRVIWRKSIVEIDLAGFVVRLMEQGRPIAEITRAMQQIDQTLAEDPVNQGESRSNFERILIVSPLAVTYEVHEEEHIVITAQGQGQVVQGLEVAGIAAQEWQSTPDGISKMGGVSSAAQTNRTR